MTYKQTAESRERRDSNINPGSCSSPAPFRGDAAASAVFCRCPDQNAAAATEMTKFFVSASSVGFLNL
jgi:hypothetical protein